MLLEAAQQEFWDHGYLATRVADIAARAKVSHGTFYTYFEDKEAALWALAEALHGDVLDTGSGAATEASGDPFGTIELANRRYLEFYVANRKTMRIMEEASSVLPEMRLARRKTLMSFAERNARALRRLQRDGVADPGLDVEVAALALATMVGQYAYITVATTGTIDAERAARTLTTIWARGIGLDVPWGARR